MSFFGALISQTVADVYITAVDFIPPINVPVGTVYGSLSLPSTVDVTLSDLSTDTVSITWDAGTYDEDIADVYTLIGTLSGYSNPGDIVAAINVSVYETGDAVIDDLAHLYYDFTLLTGANAAAISNGNAGLEDQSPNNRDATIVNTPVIREVTIDGTTYKALNDSGTQCVSTGLNGQTILNASFEIYLLYQGSDGQPGSSIPLFGGIDGVPKGINVQLNSDGKISIFYGNATSTFTWSSTSAVLNNGSNPSVLLRIRVDFEADTIQVWKSGANQAQTDNFNTVESTYPGSFSAGNISTVDPTLYDSTVTLYVGARNVSGTASSNAIAGSVVRFGIFPKLTDLQALAVQTKMLDVYTDMEASYRFPSTIDGGTITNLYGKFNYTYGTARPLLVAMMGWDQSPTDFLTDSYDRLMGYGFNVLCVGMRGRESASGSRDANGREMWDIYDAINYTKLAYGEYITEADPIIVGWSGGGGNVLGMLCKFPDLFKAGISNYGISDYGYDATFGWWAQETTRRAGLQTSIGDTPTNVPNEYKSRDSVLAIGNNLKAYLYMFHDTDDADVHADHSTRISAALISAGKSAPTDYYIDVTDSLDSPRWIHATPNAGADIINAETVWETAAKAKTNSGLGTSGTLTVLGFVKTHLFELWLGNGTSAQNGKNRVATLAYNFGTNSYTITPLLDSPATDMTYSFTDVQGRVSSGTISAATPFTPV